MGIGHQEFHPGSPSGREDISDEYPLKFRGQKGLIRTKNERLAGGSTSDVRKGIFTAEGSTETNPIAFKVYNSEPFSSAADAPWWIGPAEAGVLSANIPGIAKAFDFGWMHSGSDGKYLNDTLNLSNTPVEVSPKLILPSQFAIAIEYLDPAKYLHPEELWSIVRKGLSMEPHASSTAEGAGRVLELMGSHDLLKKGFTQPRQFAEDLLISAVWAYFNTRIELQKAGWSVADFDLSKNFVFDPGGRRWRMYDFGVADPVNENAIAFAEQLLGKDFQSTVSRRREQVRKAAETRSSNPPSTKQLRDGALTGLGFYCFTKAFNYKLPNSGSDKLFRPTGEGLTPRLKDFVDWVYDDESILGPEDIRDRIGQFIVAKMGGMSNAREIVNNTLGQDFSL